MTKKIGLQQRNLARDHRVYLSLNLLAQEVCGLLQSATLFKMRPMKINIAVKGVLKNHDHLHFQWYKNVLDVFLRTGRDGVLEEKDIDKAKNVDLRIYDQGIVTYEQTKLGLSGYYEKRYVLDGGIHTRLLDF